MPSKKKKYNARFPAGRIKKIMQTDEEVGKVAQAVPIIISRTLELFVESLLKKSMQITQARNAKTLTPSHMKQCILSESRFDFLKDLVKNIPDASVQEDNENNALYEAHLEYKAENHQNMEVQPANERLLQNPTENFYSEPNTSRSVIQFGPNIQQQQQQPPPPPQPALNFQISNDNSAEPKLHITIASDSSHVVQSQNSGTDSVPPLIPLSHNIYTNNVGDNLCIDEDYDN